MPELTWTRYPVDDLLDHISGRFGQTEGYGYAHRGVDVGVAYVPLYAPCDATVSAVYVDGDSSGFGNAIVLDHGMEFDGGPRFSVYAHLSQVFVGPGQMVAAGQRMGRTGNTGKSSGAHLHWQVCRVEWFSVDISYSYDPLAFPLATEEDMTEDDLLAIFSGKEEAHLTREERLTNARYRRDEAAAGRAPSIRDLAASAYANAGGATARISAVESLLSAHTTGHIGDRYGGTIAQGVTADDIAQAITHGADTAAGHIRFAAQRGSGG